MQVQHTLTVERRERTGSRYAARARAAGQLPAVVYGHNEGPVPVALNAKEAIRFFHSGERIFDVTLTDGTERTTVMLKDIQYDYLGTNIIHVDLERVDMDETITSNVHVRLVGEAKGVAGAVMVNANDTVEVKCAVKDIPEHIDLDISELGAGETYFVKDLVAPEGVTITSSPDMRIVGLVVSGSGSDDAEGEEEGGPDA